KAASADSERVEKVLKAAQWCDVLWFGPEPEEGTPKKAATSKASPRLQQRIPSGRLHPPSRARNTRRSMSTSERVVSSFNCRTFQDQAGSIDSLASTARAPCPGAP